ncbi:dipeptidase PepE [Flavobacteriaceae bacterium M23B6Z8]
MKNMILASTSTLHGSTYLAYLKEPLESLFENCNEVLFIPFARPGGISHEEYTKRVAAYFEKIGKKVRGITHLNESIPLLKDAEAIFTGGGNTFLLVHTLYKSAAMELLRNKILNGVPYLGTSAGSNIAGLTMQTTNDMPIIYPPSFKTMGLVPFNINAHYLDPDENSKHMGETRETRIREFHYFNTQPVVGLREGSWLNVNGNSITLKGNLTARIFEQHKAAYEVAPETALTIK